MTPEHLELYRRVSETKIYRERFGKLKGENRVDAGLPPVFDPENSEQCLWGMMDWSRTEFNVRKDGSIRVFGDTSRDRLDIALIKAILKQEEGK